MGNILGDNLKPWVKQQIDIRQNSLGKINRDTQDHHYTMTKAPFLRLASSVDVTDLGENSVLEKLLRENFPREVIEGDQLAKNLVLKGGVDLGGQSNAYGINTDGVTFWGSYGFANVDNRGYVPMPGISNAKVTYYNNGALSKTIIDIKCYSRAQFQLIDALYLRPGYTLLLEFGWSQYFKNPRNEGESPTMLTNQGNTLPFYSFMEGDVNQYELYELIDQEKEKRSGNYEAIFGKISNFNWQFLPDGTYSIQIQLTAVGDVIESLKSNIYYQNDKSIESFEINGKKVEVKNSVSNKDKTKLELFLSGVEKAIKESYLSEQNSPASNWFASFGYNSVPTSKKVDDITINNAVLYVANDVVNETESSHVIYIKYGMLMAFIQKHLLLYDKVTNLPLFEFDMDFNNLENDQNYILYIPGQFSADPRVCVIPQRDFNIADTFSRQIKYDHPLPIGLKDLDKSGFQYGKYTGRLANVMVNINAIRDIFNNTINEEDNTINTLEFINNLNNNIEVALGGINKINVRHSQDGLKIKFIEDIPQTFTEDIGINPVPSVINMYGVKPGKEGSFVRNVNLTANLSNDFASMISTGAQVDGSSIGENSTAFSSYNKGLIDRIIPTKVTSDNTEDIGESNHYKLMKIVNDIRNLINVIYSYQHTADEINELKLGLKEALTLALAILEKNSIINSPFFLPFNLGLEVDGISGMVLYQKFKVTDEVLPPYYTQDTVDMIIKGIDHNISTNGWTTNISTLTIPDQIKSIDEGIIYPPKDESRLFSNEDLYKINPDIPPRFSPTPIIDDGDKPDPKSPEDETLRVRLVRLMDDGTQTLGYMEVLDPTGTDVLFTFATSELPWKNNKNQISCIPTGKYRVESNISPNYGKCFHVVGSEDYNYTKIKANGFTRTLVKIHSAPKAPGWLKGCIAPGFKFNDSGNQKGRQKGTGTKYLNPAKAESIKANKQLVNLLFSEGSFLMTIENKTTVLPENFSEIKNFVKSKGLV